MTLSDALRAGAAELRSKRMRRIVGSVIEEVENGSSLWKALAGTGAFALHMVSLVRLGEESGKLVQNLKVIAVQQEKDRVFHSRIMSAMMYPVFVLALTVVVGTGIAWFILPRLAEVFSRLRIELPLMTRVLIAAGNFLGHYGVFAIPAAAAVILAVLAVMFWIPRTRFIGQALLFLLPGVRRLVQEVELARFGYLLGTLLEAGLGVTQALDSLAATTSFRVYGRLYARLRDLVEEGNSFQKSFALQKRLALLIPLSVQQLVVAGEQSGTLAQTLQKVHLAYEARNDMTTKNLTVILEPILLVIV
jgi:type II secretory pathway component PulF